MFAVVWHLRHTERNSDLSLHSGHVWRSADSPVAVFPALGLPARRFRNRHGMVGRRHHVRSRVRSNPWRLHHRVFQLALGVLSQSANWIDGVHHDCLSCSASPDPGTTPIQLFWLCHAGDRHRLGAVCSRSRRAARLVRFPNCHHTDSDVSGSLMGVCRKLPHVQDTICGPCDLPRQELCERHCAARAFRAGALQQRGAPSTLPAEPGRIPADRQRHHTGRPRGRRDGICPVRRLPA